MASPAAGPPLAGRAARVQIGGPGGPFAAYLYLPRSGGAKSVRTAEARPNLVVDYAADGAPIGIEILAPLPTSLRCALRERRSLTGPVPGA